MKAHRRMKVTILSAAALVVLVTVIALQTMAAYPVSGADQPSSLALDPWETPGLEFSGDVRQSNGVGEASVNIYMAFAIYPGNLVATTDPAGHYQTDFFYIPGDEMVTVWADKPGHIFTPMRYYWRHYYSHQVRVLDFTIFPPWFAFIPMMMTAGNLP